MGFEVSVLIPVCFTVVLGECSQEVSARRERVPTRLGS